MYLLQINIHVHVGETTGIVNKYVEHYESETLKPLLIKAEKTINEKSDNCFLNISFYKLDRDYIHELGNMFNEKLETHTPLLYFGVNGRNYNSGEFDD